MLNQKNRHVRFDDDGNIGQTDAQDNNDDDSKSNDCIIIEPTASSNDYLRLSLVKLRPDESFGFELRGEERRRGENRVDLVDSDSAASRAGLKPGDKLLKVNQYRVDQLNINEMFSLIECEAGINSNRLDLEIARQKFHPAKRSKMSSRKHNFSQTHARFFSLFIEKRAVLDCFRMLDV